ncbi:MAG: hypothetical protein ACRDE6_05480, partial [Candidatus Limnocylindria bacterium]
MSRSTFEQIRIPVALVLIAIAAFILWPRGGEQASTLLPSVSAAPSIIVGQPGGEVIPATPEPSPATPIPTLTLAP